MGLINATKVTYWPIISNGDSTWLDCVFNILDLFSKSTFFTWNNKKQFSNNHIMVIGHLDTIGQVVSACDYIFSIIKNCTNYA